MTPLALRVTAAAGGLVAGALLVAGLMAWHGRQVGQLVERSVQAERDRVTTWSTAVLLEAERKNRKLETDAAIAALENEVEQTRLKDEARRASDRARAVDQRLQHVTADLRRRAVAAAASPEAAGFAHEAAAAAGALGECSSRYRALGEVADGLSIQVTGLQRYVGTVLGICFPVSGEPEAAPTALPTESVPGG
jgi:hypothetical protein